MELKEFLIWLTSGSGAGVAAYALVGPLVATLEKLTQFALTSKAKRYLSLALAGVVASGAYWGTAALGYVVAPVGAQAWLEALFSVVAVAIGLSQAIHGARNL